MQFSQVIPKDITKLANFSVPGQLFICTCIVLIIFAILALAFMIFWIYRTFKGYSNTDYIADYEVKIEAEKTMKKIALEEESPEDKLFVDQCRAFSRYESRLLQFWSLLVVVAINVGTFTCGIMEAAAFVVAVLLFLIFNVFRVTEVKFLRILWVIPFIVCYIPFYVFSKQLNIG